MSRTKQESIVEKAEKALKKAVRKVVQERERTGQPLIVWKNGKVVRKRVRRSRSGKRS